jgi:antitoxin VapB
MAVMDTRQSPRVSSSRIARLFANGRSQAVRLPREFRFPGTQVRVSRHGRGVLIEPVVTDVDEWFAELDRYAREPFVPEGRRQPAAIDRASLDIG